MIDLDDYNRLRKAADRLQRKADRAKGALQQIKAQLEEKFGCTTIKEAKALLAKLEEEERTASAVFAVAMEEFTKDWGHLLNGEQS